MAVGKNKGLNKGGKKGAKRKVVDPFTKKVWYEVKAPTMFDIRKVGRTMVTKTMGQRIETDGLKGRICEFNLADMMSRGDNQSDGFKKIQLCIEEIQGKSCLTDFYGMSLTRDKMCQLVKKRQTLVEAFTDVKTTDGFVIRLFAIGFTAKHKQQTKATCYAQTAQIRKLRKKMVQVMQSEVSKGALKETVKKLTLGLIETEIEKATKRVFPLKDIHIMKVKIVKKPKLDIVRLFEMHDKTDADSGAVVQRVAEEDEAKNLLAE
jgi:small subunit ribosomal protein S3Ae